MLVFRLSAIFCERKGHKSCGSIHLSCRAPWFAATSDSLPRVSRFPTPSRTCSSRNGRTARNSGHGEIDLGEQRLHPDIQSTAPSAGQPSSVDPRVLPPCGSLIAPHNPAERPLSAIGGGATAVPLRRGPGFHPAPAGRRAGGEGLAHERIGAFGSFACVLPHPNPLLPSKGGEGDVDDNVFKSRE